MTKARFIYLVVIMASLFAVVFAYVPRFGMSDGGGF